MNEEEITSDDEDDEYDAYEEGACWDHKYRGEREIRILGRSKSEIPGGTFCGVDYGLPSYCFFKGFWDVSTG